MNNEAIVSAFHKVCQALYNFLVVTLPELLNTFSTNLLQLIRESPALSTVYDILIAILPEGLESNFNMIMANNNIISLLVGGALGLVLTFSLVRAIIKLFVGTL